MRTRFAAAGISIGACALSAALIYVGWRLGGTIGLTLGTIFGTYIVFVGQILAREHIWVNGVRVRRTYSDVPPKILRPENMWIAGVVGLVLILVGVGAVLAITL